MAIFNCYVSSPEGNLFVTEHGNLRWQNWGCVINEKEIITDFWPSNHIGRWKPSIGCLRKQLAKMWLNRGRESTNNIQKPRESNSTESKNWDLEWEPAYIIYHYIYIYVYQYISLIQFIMYTYMIIYDISTRIEPQTSDPTWKHMKTW